jgi:cell wall-associated NlpC family hydrolase
MIGVAISLAAAAAILTPTAATKASANVGDWVDVPARFWARPAIDFVGGAHPWMRDYGATHFKPGRIETRKYLAHAMVMAFAPKAEVDRTIHFGDLAQTDPFYPFAAIAVKRHWMMTVNGNFLPDIPVTMVDAHIALVQAVGLGKVAEGFSHIHTVDGYHFQHPRHVGSIELGMLLGLRYNHATEARDVRPTTALNRAEAAFSLHRAYIAKTRQTWRITSLQGYANVVLPDLSSSERRIVEFGLRFVGYPYIYGGDWFRPTLSSYCCGVQPQGGFDCSGLMWWLLKAPSGGYDNTRFRPYEGWSLGQRSSAQMASVGSAINWRHKRPGDLLFYAGGTGGHIDHVNTFVGNGYALDSSNGAGGVTLLRISTGWYRDHFVHARRIIPRS